MIFVQKAVKSTAKMVSVLHNLHISLRFLISIPLICGLILVVIFSRPLGISGMVHQYFESRQKAAEELAAKVLLADALIQKEAQNQKLKLFIEDAIVVSGADLTEVQKNNIINALIRATEGTLATLEQREFYVSVIALESKFDKNAKSSKKAIGLAQILPKYAADFGKPCGINVSEDDDLYETDTNLMLGACLFKQLLNRVHNNTILALIAYNAGPESKAFKDLKALNNIENTETSSYAVKVTYLKTEVENRIATNH